MKYLAAKGAVVTIEATAFSMPAEAKSIRLEVWSVTFVDGTEWNSFG